MADGKVPDNHQEDTQPAQQTTQQQTASPTSQGQSSSTHPGQGTANIGLTPDSVPLLVPPPTSSNISGSHDLSDSEVTDGDGGSKTDGKQNLTPVNTRKQSTSRMCEMEFKIAGQLARMKLISDKETLSSALDATSGVHMLKAHLQVLNEEWKLFQEVNDYLGSAGTKEFLHHPYVTDGVYQVTYQSYQGARKALTALINQVDIPAPPAPIAQQNQSAPSTINLAPLNITVFSGDFTK
ncbi:uncharacterized protein LOC141531757 [Cotesia typhae]|uniref:uncharacterized protein LOC141531757 n=1 Tax=Cotesia typhae TaxID=2053667 RepID=UPI003D69326A